MRPTLAETPHVLTSQPSRKASLAAKDDGACERPRRGGLPKVIEMLKEGDAEPIWNLSDAIDTLLRKRAA